jgi:putative membrane protein
MLAQLLTTGMARFLATAAAGANDTQADVAFVTKAVTTVRNEVAASTAAAKKSESRAVKTVATTMGTDQRSLSEQLLAIARAKGVSIPPGGDASPTDAPGYSDDEFVAREIKSHREAIALYEDEASSSDAQLRAFAQQILPQLHQHLAMLESLKLPRNPAKRSDGPPGRRS